MYGFKRNWKTMFILEGLKSGALLQRNEHNVCRGTFNAKVDGTLNSTLGNVEKISEDTYVLSDIPAGGPL